LEPKRRPQIARFFSPAVETSILSRKADEDVLGLMLGAHQITTLRFRAPTSRHVTVPSVWEKVMVIQ
jgi:hypothetical protein